VGVSGRRNSIIFFSIFGACLVALAITLNVGWIVLNWRTGVLFVLGILFFAIIISGVVVNTLFLIREIRRNEQQDAFLNAVTHELKTPVASIRLYLETLERREIDEAKRKEFYRIMLDDSDRLLGTIEQVLRAGRVAHGRRPQQRMRIDLAFLAEEVLGLARSRHHLEEDAIELVRTGSGAAVWVLGDREDLGAALSNLIDNAVKYSPGKVKIRVDVDDTRTDRVAVRVQDQGAGIPPTELKRIFKRFYRIPNAVAARVKGTGLGLFIVKSVAAKHGGRVYAESRGSGQGSTFTLELPAAS
jgi:signal transduction histidine kinase